MIKKITSFTHLTTAEGERITYTYSLIDEDGNVKETNKRANLIVLDDNILIALKTVNGFLQDKIPE